MILGEVLRQLVKEAGLKNEDVRKSIKVSLGNLYKLYKRDSIEAKYLESFAQLLQISVGDLLRLRNEPALKISKQYIQNAAEPTSVGEKSVKYDNNNSQLIDKLNSCLERENLIIHDLVAAQKQIISEKQLRIELLQQSLTTK